MGYVVYEVETTALTKGQHGRTHYSTESAAKAAKTRMTKANPALDLAVAEDTVYSLLIEKKVTRVNMMSGKEYMESVNTPSYCSPSSEAYWCN